MIYKCDENEQVVFKSSRNQLERAKEMDYTGDHFLAKEYCHFDGNHKRVRDFVTLTASVYHPLLRKQKVLATMQCKHENEKYVTMFWNLFNECFKLINGDAESFNPVGFMVDMAGANFNGLNNIFGDGILDRIKSCEFHFRQSYEKRCRLMDDETKTLFKGHVEAMMYAASPVSYEVAYRNLLEFISSKSELLTLLDWLQWWNERKEFIFRAFTSVDAPNSNLAEVIHAGWKNSNEINLSILHATLMDVKASLLFNQDMENMLNGTYIAGKDYLEFLLYYMSRLY